MCYHQGSLYGGIRHHLKCNPSQFYPVLMLEWCDLPFGTGLSICVTERDSERGTAEEVTVSSSEVGACLQWNKWAHLWGSSCGWVRLQELAAWLSGKVNCVGQMTGRQQELSLPQTWTNKAERKPGKWERRHEAMCERNSSMGEYEWASMNCYRFSQHTLLCPRAPTFLLNIN